MLREPSEVLTGHLSDYPLADLIGVLHHRRVTGRLRAEYPGGPGEFYFRNGVLVHAVAGGHRGVEAVALAARLPDSPFRFDPLVAAPEYSISESVQGAVLELLGCWVEDSPAHARKARAGALARTGSPPEDGRRGDGAGAELFGGYTPGGAASGKRFGPVAALAAAGASALAIVFAAATYFTTSERKASVTPPPAPVADPAPAPSSAPAPAEELFGPRGFGEGDFAGSPPPSPEGGGATGAARRAAAKRPDARAQGRAAEAAGSSDAGADAAAAARGADETDEAPARGKSARDGATVTVVTEIENGRVVRAYVANPRPGREEYEAAALRAVRQRRPAPGKTGSEEVRIKIRGQ